MIGEEKRFFEVSDRYYEKFGDVFPTLHFPYSSFDEYIRMMQHHIDTGKPYEPDIPNGAVV